jgi:hypothetical protein
MGSECTCVAIHGDPSRPCAFCRRSEDWRDTEITRLRSELGAVRWMLPTMLELAALVNCMAWSEKSFGDDNTKSITRAWLSRVESAVSNG